MGHFERLDRMLCPMLTKIDLGADAPKLGEMDQNVIDELLPSVPILVLD